MRPRVSQTQGESEPPALKAPGGRRMCEPPGERSESSSLTCLPPGPYQLEGSLYRGPHPLPSLTHMPRTLTLPHQLALHGEARLWSEGAA